MLKSTPGTMFCVQKAACSVSAKTFSTTRSSVSRAITRTGRTSSGMSLVGSRTSKSKESANSSSKTCTARSHCGKSPAWIAFQRSRRWKSGSAPLILTASSQTTDCMPCRGFQWNLTNVASPEAFTKRKVWTPKPSMKRSERGMARSDIVHSTMCVASGMSEMKSQKVSCALAACGQPRSCSSLTECTRSGNFVAS